MNGWRVSMANSMPRVTFSPTTAPIEPPIKPNSMAQQTTGRPFKLPLGSDDRVVHSQFFAGFFQSGSVRLGVGELQRIGGSHSRVVLGLTAIQQHFQALLGIHFEMELALGADQEICFQVFAEDYRAARLALHPQTFGAHSALLGRRGLLDGFFVALEPGHRIDPGISRSVSA